VAGSTQSREGTGRRGLPSARLRESLRWGRALLSVTAVGVLLVLVVPLVAGAPWGEVAAALHAVPTHELLTLTLLWAGGLVAHTVTLTAALPRLTHRRALTLSLTGSAVANVLPFGGAAGIALNYRMTRTWGFDRPAFAAYTVVTNVWDVLVKLCLPLLALAAVVLTGHATGGHLVAEAALTTGALALVALLGAVVLASDTVAAGVGRGTDRAVARLLRVVRSRREVRVGAGLLRVREECRSLVRGGWPRLTSGMVAYTCSLGVLLWGCLHATGAGVAPALVFAGFALERVLTLTGITPGGAGVVEVGLTGLLIAAGGDPVGTVAGVLLYRVFTYGLEIPVGGVGLAAWLWACRRGRVEQVA
jgi:uncharacterized membrane protein YbhN (UPF0104 family)